MSDIGDQDVNTAAIMKLAVCRAQDVAPALRSVHNTYETQQQPHFVLTVKGHTGGRLPCRINVSRTSVPLTLTQAGADAPVWATSRCTAGHDEQRWLQVSRHTPATVDFRWDRRTNETSCTSTSHGPAGTYLVEERVLKQRMQTSFVLAEAAPETTPTPNQTDDKPTSTFSSTDGFIQGANGGGVNGGTSSSPTATGPAASSSGSDPGGNGGGSSNGGLFGGPTG